MSTIITKQILEKPCSASWLEQNITNISLNCGFQAPLDPLLRHCPSWWGQRDRPTFYSKPATPIAISADRMLLHRKGQEKLESAQRFILEVPTVCGGALKCSVSVAAQVSLETGSLWGLMPQPPGHHITSQFHPTLPSPRVLLIFSLLLEG